MKSFRNVDEKSKRGGMVKTKIMKWIVKIFIATLIIGMIFSVQSPVVALAEDTVPYISKTLGDNGDGTYTLGLSVTGDAESTGAASPVNVIIVQDTSNSMTLYRVPTTYGSYGATSSGSSLTQFQLYKYENGRYSAITDGEEYTGTLYRYNQGGWGQQGYYSEYEGVRLSSSIYRADAAEKTLYDFTTALFGYQDQTDPTNIQAALITFNSGATTTQPWTSTASDITGKVSQTGGAGTHKLGYSRGTNWEAALAAAYNLINSTSTDDDPTYVVFITDGAPTSNGNGTGTNVTSQYNNSNSNYVSAMNEARLVYNAATATGGSFYGIYAFGTEADWLASLMYYAYNESETTSTNNGTTFATDGYYNASNTDELNAAISDIFSMIVETLGVGQASISDGTTSSVATTSGQIADLLEVDDSTFQYWLSWQVTTGQNGTYTFTMPDTNNKNNGNDITYTASVSGGTVTLSWSEAGTAKTASYPGSIQNNVLTVKWTAATDFYNKTPPTAVYNDSTGAVDWNLNSLGTLLDGVEYKVTFEVYPSQTTLDLIADLKNGYISYDDLHPNIKKYLSEDYQLKTNTSAALTYTDTREEKPEAHTKTFTDPPPVGVSSTKILGVSKQWNNTLDDNDEWHEKTITLYVTRDGAVRYPITMNAGNSWKGEANISYGILTRESDGTVHVKTTGHDYSFAESIDVSYNWVIDVPTVRPMLINSVETMLVLVPASKAPEEITGAAADHAYAHVENDGDYYKLTINGKVEYYKVDTAPTASLTATNHRRSYLDVTKTITGTNVPEGDKFAFTMTVATNVDGADPDNHNSDAWVWFDIYDTNAKVIVTDASAFSAEGIMYEDSDNQVHATVPDDFNGYCCVPTGTPITVQMQNGYNLRFLNLPVGTTYTIAESTTMPADGYNFVSIVGTRSFDEDQKEETTDDWTTESAGTASGQSISGTIEYVESAYKAVVTNKWNTIDVKLQKVDENGTVLNGSTFTLTKGETTIGTYSPDSTDATVGNPVDIGGLGIGIYKLKETAAPTNYATADDLYFEVYKDTDGSLKARLVDSSGAPLSDQSAISSTTGADGLIYTITIANAKKTATVKVTKNVVGRADDLNKEFTFTIKGVAEDDQTAKLVGNTATGVTNQFVTYADIPYGTSITVTETTDDNFDTTYSVNGAAAQTGTTTTFTVDDTTVNSDGIAEVVFTNTRSSQYVKVFKYATGKPSVGLEGAAFSLTGPQGTDISYTGETNTNGYLVYNNSVYFELPANSAAYTLTETKAPDGYIIMTESVTFTVSTSGVVGAEDNVTSEEETIDGAKVMVYTIKVQNSAGTELPHSGGSGTEMFTITGALLMGGAAWGLISGRRRRRQRIAGEAQV